MDDKELIRLIDEISYYCAAKLCTRRSGWSLLMEDGIHEVFTGYSINYYPGERPTIGTYDKEKGLEGLAALIRAGHKAMNDYRAKLKEGGFDAVKDWGRGSGYE